MKKSIIISAALFLALAAVSCQKENAGSKGTTTLTAFIDTQVKTALGEKEGTTWPNYWKTGDAISVNGVASDALGSEADGNTFASFTFQDVIEAPYYAAYPAAALSSYSAGTAEITLPATQKYVAGSYDPAAFIMTGKSTEEGVVSLHARVGLLHITLNGSASISKLVVSGLNGEALSGRFSTSFEGLTPVSGSDRVELVSETPVTLPADFFVCLPAGNYPKLRIEAFDSEGGSMAKTASVSSALGAGEMFSAPALSYTPSFGITVGVEGITSSTAIITWDNSPEVAYTINVYSDSGCSSLVAGYAVPAGDGCWSGESPRFCISGLQPSTTYYVKVVNTEKSVESDAVAVTTADFENVQVSSTPAAKGDVILAEDFGELCWDCDMIGRGAGWFPTEEARADFSIIAVDSYQAAATSSEKQLSNQTSALSHSRLQHWAIGANRNLYIHPGYLKLVGSSKVTHIVTPALDNIPEGMVATLEVELNASAYYSESSSSFCTKNAVVAVQTAACTDIIADETNTLDLKTNVAAITLEEESAWNTYTVTLNGVVKGNRLAFGAADGVTKNDARMNLSDIKVTIKELYEPGALEAELKGVTTSSAAFTWTHPGSSASDTETPYTISLYNDASCTDLVVSYTIPADADCWGGKQPCFVFGGLESGEKYYFRATDNDAGTDSNVVEATIGAFTNVAYDELENSAKVGDVILAENFNEWGYGTDETLGAAGVYDSDFVLQHFSGVVDMETVSLQTPSSTGRRFFHITKIKDSDTRIEHWGFAGNSSSYLRAGYLRMTTTASSNRTHLVSPKLVAIPDGKYATIEVTAKMLRTESDNDFGVLVQTGTMSYNTGSGNPESCYKLGSLASDNTYTFPMASTGSWETHTVTIKNITNANSLAFGSINNIAGKNRFYIGEISVKLTDLYDATTTELKASKVDTSSSTLIFQWTEGGSAEEDVANAYTAQLFTDAECTNAIRTFEIPAGCGAWKSKTPKFVFGGLTPSTTYWFKVTDTTNSLVSDAVKATTDAFTIVEMPSEITGAGVVLAEDFGELCWDFDYPNDAMGYVPGGGSVLSFGHQGVNTSKTDSGNGFYNGYHRSGGGEMNVFSGYGNAFSDSRLNDWYAESNIYVHPGYLKFGTSTGAGWLHTPAFTVPEGKKAVITVTLTAGRYSSDQESDWAVAVEDTDHFTPNAGKHTCSSNWMDTSNPACYQLITFTNNNTWVTKSVEGLEVHHGDRLIIGAKSGAASNKRRFQISDVTVEVTELVDE